MTNVDETIRVLNELRQCNARVISEYRWKVANGYMDESLGASLIERNDKQSEALEIAIKAIRFKESCMRLLEENEK